MSTKENITEKIQKNAENESIKERAVAIQHEALPALSEMFDKDEEKPESLLITSAERLNSLAHSFFQSRENAYLEDEKILPTVDSLQIDNICKLAETANQCMKTALDYKRERVKAFKTLVEARKELESLK